MRHFEWMCYFSFYLCRILSYFFQHVQHRIKHLQTIPTILTKYYQYIYNVIIVSAILLWWLVGLWCLTPLSTIIMLRQGSL